MTRPQPDISAASSAPQPATPIVPHAPLPVSQLGALLLPVIVCGAIGWLEAVGYNIPEVSLLLLLSIGGAALWGGARVGLAGALLCLMFQANRLMPSLWKQLPHNRWPDVPASSFESLLMLALCSSALVLGAESFRRYARQAPRRMEDEARRELLQALQTQERNAAETGAVLEQIAEGVVIADAQGRVTFVNAQAARLHGCEPDAPAWDIGSGCRHLNLDGTPFTRHEMPLWKAVERGQSIQNVEWLLQRADGSRIIAQGSATPVRAPDGRKLGAVLTLRDVSPQHKMLADSERGNKLKDQFLSVLSHELRTPLTPILGWVSLLRKGGHELYQDESLLNQAFEAIERNVLSQKNLIDDLLDATTLLSGELRLQPAPTHLNGIVSQTVQAMRPLAQARQTCLEMQLAEPSPELLCDAARIGQALRHVITNAIKFSPEGGIITIRVLPPQQNFAVVEVEDKGEGMTPEMLPHVFGMFYQGDNTFTRRHGGLGVGLTVSKSLLEMHGGQIEAFSEGLNQGARFVLRLPLGTRLPD